MYLKKDVTNVINQFMENVEAKVEECCTEDVLALMEVEDSTLIKEYVDKVQNVIISAIPEGVAVPKMSVYVTATGSKGIEVISLSLTNKIKATSKFKFSHVITKVDTKEMIVGAFKDAYATLIVNQMAEANIAEVNKMLEDLVKRAGVNYSISFVSALSQGDKVIASLTDDEVVFVADEDRVFELEDIVLLMEENILVSAERIEEIKEREATNLSTAQTTVQLVSKWGTPFIQYLANISKQVKPFNIIKKVVTKDVTKLRGDKDAVGFYQDGDIYALVAKRDGNMEVILSPFDIKNYDPVDTDVLKSL